LQKPEVLSQVVKDNKGKKVGIVYERGGHSAQTQTTLNGS